MSGTPSQWVGLRVLVAALAAACAAVHARGFFGIADTSFVTVIANPAEAANWAAELDSLDQQLAQARGTLQTVGDLKAFAGDPRAAVAVLRDLQDISAAAATLESGAQTDADLLRSWEALSASQKLAAATSLLSASGVGSSMKVFGQEQERDPALYGRFAMESQASKAIRAQISQEQTARGDVESELSLAWRSFSSATTESEKQAILSEISQIQSQNQVMEARRRAMLDDLDLADREAGTDAVVRSKAADERLLAESGQLNAVVQARAQGSEAARLATLQKPTVAPASPDYSGLKVWTTADSGGPP